jgi:hypothetical protein
MGELTKWEFEDHWNGVIVPKRPRFLWHFHIVQPDGTVIDRYLHNLVTRAGVTQIFNATFKNSSTSPWYCSMIKGAGAPTFATTDTMASHAGWTEIEGSDVSQSVRETWTPGTISSGADLITLDNSASAATYNMLTSITLQGGFLVDNSTIGGTTGNLYGEATFSVAQPVTDGSTVTLTGQVGLTAG